MAENLKLGNLRVSLEGETPFSVSQIGNILIYIEKIYLKFAERILQNTQFKLIINNVEAQKNSLDIIAYTDKSKILSYNSFEELTLCVLYSIYSIKLEKDLETTDESVDIIHNNVFALMDMIQQDQSLKLLSIIDNKLVTIKVLPKRLVLLEKSDLSKPKQLPKTKEGVLEAYELNKKALFVECFLEDTDLSNLNLSGANFSAGKLYKSNFSNSNLSETLFIDADASETIMNEVKLSHANLQEADFSNAQLIQADLSGSNLSDSDFSQANLTEAILNNVNISGTDFSGAQLKNTRFSGKIKYNKDTDFSNKANWYDAIIEDLSFVEWLKNNYPQK